MRTGGDVIVAVNGRRLTRSDDLADEISAMSAGDEVELELLRDGEHRTVRVRAGRATARFGAERVDAGRVQT